MSDEPWADIAYTIRIDGVEFGVTESRSDRDLLRQVQQFCAQTYAAGHLEGKHWYPPHRIHEIEWKETE